MNNFVLRLSCCRPSPSAPEHCSTAATGASGWISEICGLRLGQAASLDRNIREIFPQKKVPLTWRRPVRAHSSTKTRRSRHAFQRGNSGNVMRRGQKCVLISRPWSAFAFGVALLSMIVASLVQEALDAIGVEIQFAVFFLAFKVTSLGLGLRRVRLRRRLLFLSSGGVPAPSI